MGLLMMVLTIGGLGLAFVSLIVARLLEQVWLSKFVLGAVAVWCVFYTTMLFGVSFASREKTLGLNEPKEFCGFYIDCHLHASVSNVRTAKQFGDRTANGIFYIVRVKISSNARRAELGLHNPEFEVIDGQRRTFEPVELSHRCGNFFEQKIPAGGSFERDVIFDLPTDVQNPHLDISEGIGIDKVIELILIGDEDSVFHQRTRFKLAERTQTVGVK